MPLRVDRPGEPLASPRFDVAASRRSLMQALAPYRSSSAGLLVRYPALWATTAIAGVGSGLFAGMLVALVVLVGIVGAACAATQSRHVCGWLEQAARRKSERERREVRETRLEEAGICTQGLVAAASLVDRLTAVDPVLVAQLELDGLLDRYMELELAASLYARILADTSGPGGLGKIDDPGPMTSAPRPTRR
jgi:hypothetical protein